MRHVPLSSVLSEIRSGVSPVCDERGAADDDFGVLKLSAITGGRLDARFAKAIAASAVEAAWPRVRGGTLLITRASGSKNLVGACVLANRDYERRIIPDTAWELRLRSDSEVPIRWVLEFLRSSLGRRAILEIARGTSGIWKISKTSFSRIGVPVASERHMAVTSQVSERCENLMASLASLTAAKRALKRGLMSELLTGRRRFSAFAGSDAWQYVRLGDTAESITRRNVGGAIGQVLTCSGEYGLVDQRQFFSKLVAGESREDYFVIRRGEFAYNRSAMSGYPFGATKRLDRYDAGVLSTLNICFALNGDRWLSDFAVHYFESGLLNEQLRRITRVGSRAHGLLNVTKADFFALKVPVPRGEEQAHIAAVLNAADREIGLLERQRTLYESQRRGLIHRLLSGELAEHTPEAQEPVLAHA